MVVYLTRPGLTCWRPAGGEHVPAPSTYSVPGTCYATYLPVAMTDLTSFPRAPSLRLINNNQTKLR